MVHVDYGFHRIEFYVYPPNGATVRLGEWPVEYVEELLEDLVRGAPDNRRHLLVEAVQRGLEPRGGK